MAASVDVERPRAFLRRLSVVRGMSFSLAPGAIGCLLGPSGCGKTTVLRCLAGFEAIDGGSIALGGRVVSRPGFSIPPEERGVGMVFQDFALFPHLNVSRNVAFGLRRQSGADADKRVDEMLELVGLRQAARAWPHELIRRPAAARRARPRARAATEADAARRAVLQSRRRPARAAVARGSRHPEGDEHDGDPGHA